MKDFMGESGYGVIAFDLTRTGKEGLSDIPKIGDMQLHLDFHHPLPQNTSYILIMVCTFISVVLPVLYSIHFVYFRSTLAIYTYGIIWTLPQISFPDYFLK